MQEPTPSVPGSEHPRWRQVVMGEKSFEVENLGLKLLLTTIGFRRMRDSSPATIQRSIDELHAFFVKHARSVENDLRCIFS